MHKQAHLTLVNGEETSALSIADRGLAYGDGLFETMRVVKRDIPLLSYHLRRFLKGGEVLALGRREKLEKLFLSSVEDALKAIGSSALLKVIVTRGIGGRGYQAASSAPNNIVIQVYDPVEPAPFHSGRGVSIVECQYRLPRNPALAGIKHLNRLDQVMASRCLKGKTEGLVFDVNDHLVEGTKSNVLLFEKDRVLTPSLAHCGVQGTLRDYLIDSEKELGFAIEEREVDRQMLSECRALAMVNSVFGLLQVSKVESAKGHKMNLEFDERAARIHQLLQTKLSF